MDIERVNENTLKLFISYRDIEDRGYSREEIWYNRAKGEELFWDMIGEINTEDYFDLDGPIWIHVNASETGLEVIVTRANITSDGDPQLPPNYDESSDFKDKNSLFDSMDEESVNGYQQFTSVYTYKFRDIDEIIPLARRAISFGIPSSLYKFDNSYYLAVDFTTIEDKTLRQNIKAIINEYLNSSKLSIYRLAEYGELIMQDNCFQTVTQYFD
ncbi:adaptor protein MecA [Ureibacillus manganicus]|uniref:Adapter protein MecA n=1 Tax=Ureibacillus manganicus DSM 26584 TaxID=1384049 RepID=A0A0A3ICL1_9BACL|nr:adaptor protein MecA [Ureibacillus manganicus]KGR80558.1 adapter protein mecA [Ureibacillus manganicus DSM 26584]